MAEILPMLALSPTMEKGLIIDWKVKEGDNIKSGDLICEVETDKASMDYTASVEGFLLKIIVQKGSEVKVGEPIAIIGEKGEKYQELLKETKKEENLEEPAKGSVEEIKESKEIEKKEEERIKISPLARRMASQNNIDFINIEGSGPQGRIVKKDIEKAIEKKSITTSYSSFTLSEDQEIPISGKRMVTAQRLSESKFSAPHYYLKVSTQMDELIYAREKLNKGLNQKVSFNSFFIKMAAEALKKHPQVNASWKGDSILRFGHIDIGFAVAVEDGLLAPVIRDCGNKGIIKIDKEFKILIEKAKSSSLKIEDMTGATFTISNLGSFGIEEFTAIINPPGSAILALGEIQRIPAVMEDDGIDIISSMKMTLSCDHRVIDGAAGASFLNYLRDIMENPIKALY